MSTIDFSKAQDLSRAAASGSEASDPSDHAVRIKQDCTRKITEQLDLHTLVNAQTAALLDRLSEAETRTLAEGQQWIEAMLHAARSAAQRGEAAEWPAAPETLEVLRARF